MAGVRYAPSLRRPSRSPPAATTAANLVRVWPTTAGRPGKGRLWPPAPAGIGHRAQVRSGASLTGRPHAPLPMGSPQVALQRRRITPFPRITRPSPSALPDLAEDRFPLLRHDDDGMGGPWDERMATWGRRPRRRADRSVAAAAHPRPSRHLGHRLHRTPAGTGCSCGGGLPDACHDEARARLVGTAAVWGVRPVGSAGRGRCVLISPMPTPAAWQQATVCDDARSSAAVRAAEDRHGSKTWDCSRGFTDVPDIPANAAAMVVRTAVFTCTT